MKRVLIKSALVALTLSLIGVRSVHAYIDPNTGGMLFQILAVAFASLSALALIFSRQIRMLFARVRRSARDLLGIRQRHPSASGTTSPDSDQVSGAAKALSTDAVEIEE